MVDSTAPTAQRAHMVQFLTAASPVLNSVGEQDVDATLDNLGRYFDPLCCDHRAKASQPRRIDKNAAEKDAVIRKEQVTRDAMTFRFYGEAKILLGGRRTLSGVSIVEMGKDVSKECIARHDTLDRQMYDSLEENGQKRTDILHVESEEEILDDLRRQYDEISKTYRTRAWRIYTDRTGTLDEEGLESALVFNKTTRKQRISELYKKIPVRLEAINIFNAASLTENARFKECIEKNDSLEELMLCNVRRIWAAEHVENEDADDDESEHAEHPKVSTDPRLTRAGKQVHATARCLQHTPVAKVPPSLKEVDNMWRVSFLALQKAREMGLEADVESAKAILREEWLRRVREDRKARAAVEQDAEG